MTLLSLQPQDLALTIFGGYLRDPGDLAWSGGMVVLLGELGFSMEAARAALSRLASRELIARTRRGRQVFYQLTPRAQELLAEGDRRIFGFGVDVGTPDRWTVLWHWLPESRRIERARLGRRLRFLGFGTVRDATWIAPHDREQEVIALLRGLGVSDHAYLLVGRPAQVLDIGPAVAAAWDLDAVSRTYEAFLAELAPYRADSAQAALDDREAFIVRTRALHLFRGFPFEDPELPDALMPDPSLRPEVVATFHQLYEQLRGPAAQHFAAVAGAATRPAQRAHARG